jgi:isoquinoline 1-oxidoreductase subunit beta
MFKSSIGHQFQQRDEPRLNRRGFLLVSAAAAGTGLALGVMTPGPRGRAHAAGEAGAAVFNPFVRITPDNKVIVLSKHLDKGQGTASGLATLVAEELDADWAQMQVEFAPANVALYANTAFGVQGTGGSSAMSNSFEQYRRAGAAARAMLVGAAAAKWGVPAAGITVAKGIVSDGTNSAAFGDLAEAASKRSVPAEPTLKDAKDFIFIGKSFPRLDAVAKTTAQPVFTQDVRLPDMVTAVVARPPRFGAKVTTFDATAAKKVAGVVDVVQIPQGVAVLATGTWAAIQGREVLKVSWDDSAAEMRSSETLLAEFKALAATPGVSARRDGDAALGLGRATKTIEAEFVFPYLAHATMEPLNCVMQFKDGACTVWTGSQLQTVDQNITAATLGIRPEDVAINTLWAGGSFGRRGVYNADYIAETAALVKAYGKPVPVKIVWTREDDIKGGYYRPMAVHRVKAGITAEGTIAGWQHRIVTQSIMTGTAFESMGVKNGIDGTSVEGIADSPYAIPNFEVELHSPKIGVPPLWWRSVGHSHTAYVMESVIDELAGLAGKDPVEFRLSLLEKQPRHRAVLALAAEKAGWGKSELPQGIGRGVAVHESFKSFVAQVADVRFVDGKPKVERVVCAVDCGVAINPDNIASQMEGGIGYGLGAVLHSKITLKDGLVEQSNFDGYQVLRFDEMPTVEVHIVPSTESPTGVGEPGVPPIGPAVGNAIAALTGKRVRELPFALHKFDGAA